MANKKISQLSSSLSPSLSGVTVIVDNNVTYKSTLQTLKTILIESGSHSFIGNQTISGSLNVTGSVTASYFVGNGSNITNLSLSNINVSSLSTTGSNIFIGNQTISGSLNVTGSVTASYFIGNGSNITNLPVQNFLTSSLATTGSNSYIGNQNINGFMVLSNLTSSFNGDSEAAAGGIPLYGVYRTDGFLLIRLT